MVTRQQVSAGGVVCRRREDKSVEVALVATHAAGDGRDKGTLRWGLPKGLVAPGESHEAAALREVREETGLEATIVEALEPIEYWYWGTEDGERVRYHKRVYFFLMACRGGDLAQHDWEVDAVEWFPIDEAAGVASFRTERQLLSHAREIADRVKRGA